jgi:hypothetical protein
MHNSVINDDAILILLLHQNKRPTSFGRRVWRSAVAEA